jgi:hypothetical protein
MKRTVFLLALVLFPLVILPACNLSAPAPAATPDASATPTLQIYPTITITPSPTLTLTPSLTPIPSLTPTPDIRIIAAPAQNFKLQAADLPPGYSVVQDAICRDIYDPQCQLDVNLVEGPDLNYEIIQEFGAKKGGSYVNDTSRVEGWYVYYHYNYSYKNYPRVIMSSVIRFANADGARAYMSSYAGISVVPYKEVIGYPQTGDAARAFTRLFYGDKYLYYEFSYKNMIHRLWFYGTEENIAPNLIQDLSFKALLKFQAAELSFPAPITLPPTLTPAPGAPVPDARVIAAAPFDLILAELDLPAEGKYRLTNLNAPHHNDRFTQDYPGGKGDAYLLDVARVDGWDTGFKRGANDMLIPAQITDQVGVFETAAGAQKHVAGYAAYFLGEDWVEDAPQNVVGDATRVFIKQDGVYEEYLLVFSYRNVAHQLTLYGLRAEIDPAFAEMAAFNLLRKLQAAPLAE